MTAPKNASVSGEDFYRRILDVLEAGSIEFMVGGAFALRVLAGIERDTKDFDLMLRPRDVERTLQICREAGFHADYAFSHWLAKVHFGEHFIDLIYRAGNGLCEVDDVWFEHTITRKVFDRPLRICPPEEIIWQKAFIMERERFDGGDVQHLLRSHAETMDWRRLLARFGDDWRVLFSHLVVFGFVYPDEKDRIPRGVMKELTHRLQAESVASKADLAKPEALLCQGTLLSRAQYLPDVERWGYRDVRETERVNMSDREISAWTNAIEHAQRSR